MPLSTSSNTMVGDRRLVAASTTFRASMKRASSPPEAILASGPGGRPGLVDDFEGDAVHAGLAPLLLRQRLDRRAKGRLVELERRQFGGHGAVEPLGGAGGAPPTTPWRRRQSPSRAACSATARRVDGVVSGVDAPPTGGQAGAAGRPGHPPRRRACGRRRARRTAALRRRPRPPDQDRHRRRPFPAGRAPRRASMAARSSGRDAPDQAGLRPFRPPAPSAAGRSAGWPPPRRCG